MTPEQRQKLIKELKRAGCTPGLTTRAAGMVMTPDSFDAEARSARFVATSEQYVTVFDWERFELIEEVLVADGMIVPDSGSVSLLDTHSRSSVQDVLGSASDFQDCLAGDLAAKDCLVTFSRVQAGRDAGQKVEEGHINAVSVGYKVTEAFYVPAGERQLIGGKEYAGPVKVSTKWELRELSLVPIGADSLAKVRAEFGVKTSQEENDVNEELRKFLESRGLAKDADDATALRFMQDLASRSDADQLKIKELENRQDGATVLTQADVEAAGRAAVAAERTRVNDINEAVSAAGLGADYGRGLVNEGVTIDAARAAIIQQLKDGHKPIGAGAGRTEVGLEAPEKFRAAAVDGLLIRSGVQIAKPADGHRGFRGMSLLDLARESLEHAGVNCRGLSRMELAGRAISSASTSDFPALMASVSGRHLMAAYEEAPATWRPMASVVGASDFKDMYGVALSGSPDLDDLGENGEYKTAKFSDKQEKYRVISKGRLVRLTRQMLINDDLRAFTRITSMFGAAARRMEADAVYGLITANPLMADGKNLFHADHNNLEATVALQATINSGNLSAARTAMRKQKGMAGELLNIVPGFVLVPLEQETDSEILLRSAALPDVNMSSGVHNPWAGRLTPIADAHLSESSAVAWYMVASPNQAPVIEAAYLEGEEQPFIDEEMDFNSDSLVIKVRHDFGAGLMDHRGIFKNAGE
ncbi:MAG: Mu-like prophage major head subunit gpT family protein [Desulfobulbaceae bacterium]|jgi:phage major head subunit gpT-like protein|nr:Mu-like prophage major head subunit gpT family protein [Desulfobulbaceae bacterium]